MPMPFHTKVPERAIRLYEILRLWLEWQMPVIRMAARWSLSGDKRNGPTG